MRLESAVEIRAAGDRDAILIRLLLKKALVGRRVIAVVHLKRAQACLYHLFHQAFESLAVPGNAHRAAPATPPRRHQESFAPLRRTKVPAGPHTLWRIHPDNRRTPGARRRRIPSPPSPARSAAVRPDSFRALPLLP